jgi:hypothetical protein
MYNQRVSKDILTKAAEAVGGDEALAKTLGRNLEDVQEWLSGKRLIPIDVYLEACRVLLDHPDYPKA